MSLRSICFPSDISDTYSLCSVLHIRDHIFIIMIIIIRSLVYIPFLSIMPFSNGKRIAIMAVVVVLIVIKEIYKYIKTTRHYIVPFQDLERLTASLKLNRGIRLAFNLSSTQEICKSN